MAEVSADAPTAQLRHADRFLLRAATVLSLDPGVGDFESADILVEHGRIIAIEPQINADAVTVDCSGLVALPGFVQTHHHQYETLMRSAIPDGLLFGAWPQESYMSVIQGIWTVGRIGDEANPVWDLGRSPLEPDDVYLAELVSSLSLISHGVTMAADTSQSSHTPDHTDAMIQGLMDSGQRALYVYSRGENRQRGFEFPGSIDDHDHGIGRLASRYFASKDQLVTLGAAFSPDSNVTADGRTCNYTGWQLARAYDAHITLHSVGDPAAIVQAANDPRNGTDWSDVTLVHCTRWHNDMVAQIGAAHSGYPNSAESKAMELLADRGAHISLAPLIEMQMGHGVPPLQLALNYGVLPSLSPDVETNMTPEPFSLMRSAFTLQRGLASELAIERSNPGNLQPPQLITSRLVLQMMTLAGAAGNGVLDRVGTLTPGKEADITFLDARNLQVAPMLNVPGAVVTLMNQSHVRHVMIAGRFRFWNKSLVGIDVPSLVSRLEQAQERVLGRIRGRAKVGALPPGNNSAHAPYAPNRFGSSSFRGQNVSVPHYDLRP